MWSSLAIDVKISGENRFKGKPVVRMSTEKAMKKYGSNASEY